MSRRAARIVRCPVVLIPVMVAAGLSAGARDAGEQLSELRRAIEARRAQVAAFGRRERGLLETLETLDRTAEQVARGEARARAEAKAARAALDELDDRAAALERRRERTRGALAARAVALYKTGELGPVRLLFSARDLRELFSRTSALRSLIEHDRALLDRFQHEGAQLAGLRVDRNAAAAERDRALAQLERRRRALADEVAARKRLVAQVSGSRARERRALAELETAAEALEETLLALDSGEAGRRLEGPSFSAQRGRLPPPVAAPITRRFGRVVDARFRTQTFRKGIDFGAPAGSPVRAVADGAVRFAGWFRGYGKLAILGHSGDYFTVSAHLAELSVRSGDRVSRGDVIGTVGDTGSLAGPLLYFEIRKGGEPQDPEEWFAP